MTNESENDKLLRLIREKQQSKKRIEKFLTNEKAYDNINKLVAEKQPNSFEKSWKSSWQREKLLIKYKSCRLKRTAKEPW